MTGLKQTTAFRNSHPSVKLLKHIRQKTKNNSKAVSDDGTSKAVTHSKPGILKKTKIAIEPPGMDKASVGTTKVEGEKPKNRGSNHKSKRMKQGKYKKREKLDKRGRRLLKLKSKKHFAVVQTLIPLWEVLRRENTTKDKCFQLIEEILKAAKDKLIDLCMAHDTARIIESVVQHGTEAQRWIVFAELKRAFRLLSKSRYAKFVMLKLIKYGAKEHRLEMLKAFRNHFARLVKHRISAEVVELLYNDYANATQRGQIMQELYGNVYALTTAEDRTQSLPGLLALNADKQFVILANLSQLLTALITKGLTKHSIVQHLLLEFLQAATPVMNEVSGVAQASPELSDAVPMEVGDESGPPEKTESIGSGLSSVLEALVDGHVVPMLHTREGVRASLHALWACPVKLRKTLVRGLKTCVSNIARSEHGHLFLIGLLDTVDDIQLLNKYIIKEIRDDLNLFVCHPEARKVLLYILSPRDRHHFSPQLQASIFSIFNNSPHTKKSLGMRAMELRSPSTVRLLPKLLQMASTEASITDMFVGGVGDQENLSESARLAMEDRGRIILLTEMLLRSAPHHLDPAKVVTAYTRPGVPPTVTVPVLSAGEIQELTDLRLKVFKSLINRTLLVPFRPMETADDAREHAPVDHEALRTKRHRQATVRAEAALVGGFKPYFALFESNAEKVIQDASVSPACRTTAFIERPEGQLMFRRLLQDGHEHNDFTLSRVILESVPIDVMLTWIRCNRGCFLLINLCELGDPALLHKLKISLKKCIPDMRSLWHAGAKVLLKHIKGIPK